MKGTLNKAVEKPNGITVSIAIGTIIPFFRDPIKNYAAKCITLIAFILSGMGCHYSFTGITIPPEAKTFTVNYFRSNAPLASPVLSQTFTEALKDQLISQTKLSNTGNGGDLVFDGSITGYNTSPAAIQSNEQAALTRLTITVTVKYTNRFDDKKNFESSFSRYADFNSTQALSSVETTLIQEINKQLIEDILNKALNNW